MDKNFVHIDELFRQGLSEGAEPEQSGAWLKMQDLLDKDMPVSSTIRGRSPYRRYFSILLLLMLLGGGAYMLNRQYQHSDMVADASAPNQLSANNNFNQQPDHTAGNAIAAAIPIAENSMKANQSASYQKIADNQKHNNTNVNIADKAKSTQQQISSIHQNSNNLAGIESPENAKEKINEEQTANPQIANAIAAANNANSKIKEAARNKSDFDLKNLKIAKDEILKTAKDGNLYASKEGNLLKETSDSINQITIKERVSFTSVSKNGRRSAKPVFTSDTINRQRIPVKTLIPLRPIEMAAISGFEIKPNLNIAMLDQSAMYASGERAVSLVTLSKYEVSSKKSTPEKINNMIGQTKNSMTNLFDGSRNFYTSLLLGGNYAVSNPSAWGLQIGAGFFYVLSERLTLGAEAKYVNRNYNNYSFIDKFNTYANISSTISGGNYVFNYDEQSHTTLYRIKNLGSLELPVYLNYSFGRFSVFGGANMAYAFSMHPVVSNQLNVSTQTYTAPSTEFKYDNEPSRVFNSDFKSRFGIGYIFGAQYDFSRKLSLDFRMTQLLWDNAATDVSKQISRDVFRTPSVQLGLNFYFGRRDKVIYMMDYRK